LLDEIRHELGTIWHLQDKARYALFYHTLETGDFTEIISVISSKEEQHKYQEALVDYMTKKEQQLEDGLRDYLLLTS
jgi:hypothetical protein